VKRFAFFFAVLLSCATAASSDAPKRPRILGIAGVKVFCTDLRATRNFYSQVLGAKETSPNTFSLNSHQVVSLFGVPSPAPSNFLAEVVFETDSLGALLTYLGPENPGHSPFGYSPAGRRDSTGILDPFRD
jgi:catechol 2,3-dioxygenase-like lactoylglutathione lyase family enzyme